MIKGIIFADDYSEYVNNTTFVGIFRNEISTKEELVGEYWNKFKCQYGSISWDSLEDIISDFTWIDATRILIVHENIPNLTDRDLKIYLNVLNDNSWFDPQRDIENDSKKLGRRVHDGVIVIFPRIFKDKIEKILSP